MSLDLHRRLPRGAFVYLFIIDLVKVSGVPYLPRSSELDKSGKRKLKVTVLHGSKQKEVGDFDIIRDKCVINKRISCRLLVIKPDHLGKLHVYIDQDCSSGLTGHIAIDLKEFVHEQNQELCLEYPLSARDVGVLKLKVSAECTCLQEAKDLLDQDFETFEVIEQRLSGSCSDTSYGVSSSPLATISSRRAECMAVVLAEKSNQMVGQVQNLHGHHDSANRTLQKLEGILLDLDSRLKSLLSTYRISYQGAGARDNLLELQNQSKFEWAVQDFSECFVCSERCSDIFEGLSLSSLESCDSCSSSSDMYTSCEESDVSQPISQNEKLPVLKPHHSSRFSTANMLKLILIVGVSALGAKTFRNRGKSVDRLNFLKS